MFRTRKLLLIDGIGALVSAISLGVLLPMVQSHIGLPTSVVLILAGIAGIFASFSTVSYLFAGQKWKLFLRIIAFANVTYCGLTLSLLWVYFETLKPVGIVYFMGEIILVVSLAVWELRIAFQK